MTSTQTPPPGRPEPGPGRGRAGALPAIGCVVILLALVIVFGTAVGGSLQSLAILGGLIALGGIAVIVFLARKNRGA